MIKAPGSGFRTVVEQFPHVQKVEGLSPAADAATWGRGNGLKVQVLGQGSLTEGKGSVRLISLY
jgi:hypothetical protein